MTKRIKRHITVYSDDPRFIKGEVLKTSFGLVKVIKVSSVHEQITTKKIVLEKLEEENEQESLGTSEIGS